MFPLLLEGQSPTLHQSASALAPLLNFRTHCGPSAKKFADPWVSVSNERVAATGLNWADSLLSKHCYKVQLSPLFVIFHNIQSVDLHWLTGRRAPSHRRALRSSSDKWVKVRAGEKTGREPHQSRPVTAKLSARQRRRLTNEQREANSDWKVAAASLNCSCKLRRGRRDGGRGGHSLTKVMWPERLTAAEKKHWPAVIFSDRTMNTENIKIENFHHTAGVDGDFFCDQRSKSFNFKITAFSRLHSAT